eukprot:SAG22_NODE_238_length_14184_cov_5.966844_4_plen_210_part_00
MSPPAPAAADYTHTRPLALRIKDAAETRATRLALQREAAVHEQTEELLRLQNKVARPLGDTVARGQLVTVPRPDSLPALWSEYAQRNTDWTTQEIYAESARSSYYSPSKGRGSGGGGGGGGGGSSPAKSPINQSASSSLLSADGSFDEEGEGTRSVSPFRARQSAYARKRALLAQNSLSPTRASSDQGFHPASASPTATAEPGTQKLPE